MRVASVSSQAPRYLSPLFFWLMAPKRVGTPSGMRSSVLLYTFEFIIAQVIDVDEFGEKDGLSLAQTMGHLAFCLQVRVASVRSIGPAGQQEVERIR